MDARLEGLRVVVDDESVADRVYNNGAYGVPQSGGGLHLHLVEAAYLVEVGRLEVEAPAGGAATAADLTARAVEADAHAAALSPVFRDLRERGHVVRPPSPPGEEGDGPEDLHLYPRGGFPGKTPSDRHVIARLEDRPVVPDRLRALARRAADLDKTLLVGLVDREADVTYYEATVPEPEGDRSDPDLPGTVPVHRVGARALVLDGDAREALEDAHLGRRAGPVCHLAPEELGWLEERGGVEVQVTHGAGAKDAPDAARRTRVYADLRERGLLPRSGFKYGADLRVYETDPDEGHAPLLVDAAAPDEPRSWTALAGRVRMAQSVRKRYLLALVPQEDPGPPSYLEFERTRP